MANPSTTVQRGQFPPITKEVAAHRIDEIIARLYDLSLDTFEANADIMGDVLFELRSLRFRILGGLHE